MPVTSDGAKTLLEQVRFQIEQAYQQCISIYNRPEDSEFYRLAAIKLTVLREAVMAFETGDRSQTGEEYEQGYETHLSGRIPTDDYVGVFIPGCSEDRDIEVIRTAILNDDLVVQDWIATALQKCANGQPAQALALGRDLHWLSCGNPEREKAAVKLLEVAYRALNRDALAEIALIDYQHRSLPSVYVYQ